MMELFHTGHLVSSIEAATTPMTATGLQWREPVAYDPLSVWSSEGPLRSRLRRVYSVDGPPYVELIEEPAGLVFGPGRPGGTLHLGFWTTDMAADCARLEAAGMTRVVADVEAGPPEGFVLYRPPSGPHIELLAESRRPFILGDDH
jgi:hypothetical protein